MSVWSIKGEFAGYLHFCARRETPGGEFTVSSRYLKSFKDCPEPSYPLQDLDLFLHTPHLVLWGLAQDHLNLNDESLTNHILESALLVHNVEAVE